MQFWRFLFQFMYKYWNHIDFELACMCAIPLFGRTNRSFDVIFSTRAITEHGITHIQAYSESASFRNFCIIGIKKVEIVPSLACVHVFRLCALHCIFEYLTNLLFRNSIHCFFLLLNKKAMTSKNEWKCPHSYFGLIDDYY